MSHLACIVTSNSEIEIYSYKLVCLYVVFPNCIVYADRPNVSNKFVCFIPSVDIHLRDSDNRMICYSVVNSQ